MLQTNLSLQPLESLLLSNPINPLQKLVGSDIMSLAYEYQQSVAKQKLLLHLLLLQNQSSSSRLDYPKKETNVILKSEPSAFNSTLSYGLQKTPLIFPKSVSKMIIDDEKIESKSVEKTLSEEIIESCLGAQREKTCETQLSSHEDFLQKYGPHSDSSTTVEESGSEAGSEGKSECKIRRRNGFKTSKELSQDQDELSEYIRKSNKVIVPKRPPSKAKHLWINYGRKIIEFAVNHTKDEVQARIKQLIGKLSSKKDFEDVFGVQTTDSESDKSFKILFGKLALYFIKFKSDIAFEGSKYREQMVTQKPVVASWISKLINESN